MVDSLTFSEGLPSALPRLRVTTKVADDSSSAPGSAHAGCCAMPAAARAAAAAASSTTSGGRSPELSPVSQLFLGMGDASPDIYAIMRLRGYATSDQIAPAMQQLVDAHDRFRMRVVCRGGMWCTELLDEFDVHWCMREVTLDGPDIDEAFNGFVARLMSGATLSEGALPPWDCSVVHFASDPQHTDVLLRCSHMIGDGQLFMQLLREVLQEAEDEAPAGDAEDDQPPDGDRSVSSGASSDSYSSSSSMTAGCHSRSSSDGTLCDSSGNGGACGGSSDRTLCGGASGGTAWVGGSCAASPAAPRDAAPVAGGLIRAVRHQTAFLPPPSLERAERQNARRVHRHGKEHQEGHGTARRGRSVWQRVWRAILHLWGWLTSALFVVCMPFRIPDPVNAVKASRSEIGGPRAFSSITLPLDEMRHVSKVLGVTINTLAVSCLAGGLRRHLLQTGGGAARCWWWRRAAALALGGCGVDCVPRSLLLCSMVDTRAMRRSGFFGAGGASGGGGGCNTLSFIGVPVDTSDSAPLARLVAVGAALAWIRGSLGVLLAVLIPPIIQFVVRDMALSTAIIMWMLPAKTTLGFSNMRGPVKPVALRGFRVERMYNGVQPNYFGSFISLMSYDNQATFVNSCYTSKSSCPHVLLECVRAEWHALHSAATVPAPLEMESDGQGKAKTA